MKQIIGELSVSVVLLALLFTLFNPWQMAMPDYVVTALLSAVLILFAIFAVFLWREGHGDERERLHQMFADRVAYLAGSAVLVLGIIVQEARRGLDYWLLGALAVMIIAKVVGLIYTKIKL